MIWNSKTFLCVISFHDLTKWREYKSLSVCNVCQFRFHKGVFKSRNLEHADTSGYDHLYNILFNASLMTLTLYGDHCRLKTILNGLQPKGGQGCSTPALCIQREKEVEGYAKVTLHLRAVRSRGSSETQYHNPFLQQLFGFCNSFQVLLLEMFMCF